MSLKAGEKKTVTVTTVPEDASDKDTVLKTISWTTSDGAVATVTNGEITASQAGTATVKATSGGYTASVKVTVTDPA